jgi:hypothetical protein
MVIFHLLAPDHEALFAHERRMGTQRLLVVANMSAQEVSLPATALPSRHGQDILTGERISTGGGIKLMPYAAFAILE